eukprot:TRINITY_DN906_c1_g1_i3.p1 TRINITY_DN906_c1_g1~~TRINITY_DN906_c1_g1_i3.p1  ORF type:complete len:129 (-),score=24.99 TRINITY_DN906_c1_g1_i3:559-945(-)
MQVKNLLSIHPADEVPVKHVTIRKIPRVPEDMPLYNILNEFQKGHSHMAVVIRCCKSTEPPPDKQPDDDTVKDVRLDIDGEKPFQEKLTKKENTPEMEKLSLQCAQFESRHSKKQKVDKRHLCGCSAD